MNDQEKDFTEEYKTQLKKFSPYIFYIIFWFALFLLLPVIILSFHVYSKQIIYPILIIMLLLIIPIVPAVLKVSKCPNCRKYMGRDIGKFCPICGVRIRK